MPRGQKEEAKDKMNSSKCAALMRLRDSFPTSHQPHPVRISGVVPMGDNLDASPKKKISERSCPYTNK